MSADVPNVFILTIISEVNEWLIMKITGVLVYLLVEMSPEVYVKYFLYNKISKVLYVVVMWYLHGMSVVHLLWYNKFHSDLKDIGF